MAHYRNLVVNDVRYRYVVGREATKVQNRDTGQTRLYKNAEWGTPLIDRQWETPQVSEVAWAGKDTQPLSRDRDRPNGFVVRPGDVRGMILGERRWKDYPCRDHPQQIITGLTGDPFAGEIEGLLILVGNCPICNYHSWMET